VKVEIFEQSPWQMSLGERAAVEGVLAQLKPSLAIEIGSMEGACLQRIAEHADEAHSFDLAPPSLPMPGNVVLHTGDSHQLLAQFLSQLADEGRNVDFVLVDGDHTPEGVRQDIEDLLNSRAVAQTVILLHDTASQWVREGIDSVRFEAWPKVGHVELDWIPGRLFAEPALRNELWYGLGLVLVDSARLAYADGSAYEQRYRPAGPLLAEVQRLILARERVPEATDAEHQLAELRLRLSKLMAELGSERTRSAEFEAELLGLQDRVQRAELTLEDIKSSASWRLTEPLRTAKRRVRGGE
jgi:hypothetical protein